ncbi:hypothetical protein FEDK69T_29890 [Flavobacterium enshiense DK69]|uniref:Uncharacterized protein n=1 Tax=Flavobacterium enshiense DK69 TaxID=1107311 RepID=V6S2I7_9FLAO|nr:hypothetical protein [Flavobacterium enshiense]ESU20467.1 hypothetical protein FEDK69T_29890 [Flavobacterium enshiense DK69]KGO95726.1 hypothetical protein Q767_08520 [Flavobacterium enshiense DK69]
MKKFILHMSIFVFLVVTVISIKCSVEGITFPSDDNIGETKTIKVKEYKTNLPISGAKFTTYYCKEHDFEFGGCLEEVALSTCTTNNNGACNCAFPERSFNRISIERNDYWSKHFQIESNNVYTLQPQAWVTINFNTETEYPATSQFFIRINGEIQSIPISIQAVNNSTRVLTVFGNEENRVVWELRETFNMTSPLLNSGNFTLNPKKLEHLKYTLHY